MDTHSKCSTGTYPGGPTRSPVTSVSWETGESTYEPKDYTSPIVLGEPVWADKLADLKTIQFNKGADVNKYTRISHTGKYFVDEATNLPRNPVGRTGITGRGLLGKFGPNFAADPIVSRWKRDGDGNVVTDKSGLPILQVVLIKRKDNGEWALPGGMVDGTEEVSQTLAREFSEEALNSLEMPKEELKEVSKRVDSAFKHGVQIYKGYVDDPRNTDNAWMETTAMNFHDEDGTVFSHFKLHGGDDAGEAAWVDIESGMKLYASHGAFIATIYENHVKKPLN